VRLVQKKLGWKEVGDEDDWQVYWTDTSVSIERIMRLKKTQVYPSHSCENHLKMTGYIWPIKIGLSADCYNSKPSELTADRCRT
jgi:hypothetical protein